LQRLTAGPKFLAATNVIALEFAIQGRAADAEHLAGESFVALHLFENAFNRRPFDVFEIGGGNYSRYHAGHSF